MIDFLLTQCDINTLQLFTVFFMGYFLHCLKTFMKTL